MTPWLLGLLAGGVLFSRQQVNVFERAAAADLHTRLIGPGSTVHLKSDVGIEAAWGELQSVKISASKFGVESLPFFVEPKRSKKGWIHNLTLDFQDFNLSNLHVLSLRAEVPDCNFDFALASREKKVRLSKSGVGTAEVRISQSDLEAFILKKYKWIKKLNLRIDKDKFFAEGHADLLVLAADFFLVGSLIPVQGSKLALTRARLMLNGKMATEDANKSLLAAMNPVADLDRDLHLFGAMDIQELKLSEGVITATGPIHFPDLPTQGADHR